MNAQGMLEQLLKSGLSMIEGKAQVPGAPAAGGGNADWVEQLDPSAFLTHLASPASRSSPEVRPAPAPRTLPAPACARPPPSCVSLSAQDPSQA